MDQIQKTAVNKLVGGTKTPGAEMEHTEFCKTLSKKTQVYKDQI